MVQNLILSLGASGLWTLLLALTHAGTWQVWPPARGNWLTAIWAWGLTILIYMGLIGTASADWNALDLPAWLRWGVGGVALTVLSTLVQGRAIVELGLAGTSGWDVGLVTHGSYARRRHPQYAGQILSLWGLALLGGSAWAMLAAAAGSAALAYAAWVEDQHLAARHATHAAWRARTRFLF